MAEGGPSSSLEYFKSYAEPARRDQLPRYTAGALELVGSPDKRVRGTRHVVSKPTSSGRLSWQPYTIPGKADWSDYGISAYVWLTPRRLGGALRVHHKGDHLQFCGQGPAAEKAWLSDAAEILLNT